MRNTKVGMNNVPMIRANSTRLPGNSSRARAYAARTDVATTSSALAEAATRLLKNQSSTGVSDSMETRGT
jgi:hypothetical protein